MMAPHGLTLRLQSRIIRLHRSPTPYGLSRISRQASGVSTNPLLSSPATTPQAISKQKASLHGSSFTTPDPPEEVIKSFNPAERARRRTTQLPPSRYQFRPPKYYRGPLHPHQPPSPSDPASREFIPGPFSLPRLQQTYTSTLRPDLLTLCYQHIPYGYQAPPPPSRLREWDNSSPYYKNRPLRAPRNANNLSLLPRHISFRNVPEITRVTVSSMIKQAAEDSAYLHVAGMALQAITGVRANVHIARRAFTVNRTGFNQRKGKPIAVSCDLRGEMMYEFLAKVIEVVAPGVKEWKGVKGSSGDGSGNLGFGFRPETVGSFPEIAVNYDSYPSKMIPGIDIIVHTTATTDKHARLLIASMGVPFYGKHLN